ncbi:hypothetical protein RCT70_21170 [Escherichia marmotae]|uniref:hypothetical protein n=1 Tax=Escherichia marmotae TaxID=1499973 RepID=UPI002E1A2CD7|nr:hypothetical protein [Escherichia marmotae]
MHYRNVVCLLSCSLFLSSAWGCRLDEPEHNIYQKQGKGVVYLRPYEKTNLSLPQINYKRLHLLPNLLIDPTKLEDWETVPPATDLTTDVVYSGVNATFPHYSYYSDGRAILYAGEVVQNPPGTPPVDISSFQAWGDFAADKYSLYYEGKRTDSNQQLNRRTLRQVEFNPQWKPDWLGLILRDKHYLYANGQRLDDPNLIINKRFNAGKRHGYLLTRTEGWPNHSSLHVFESDGPLILLDNRSPDEREAHLNDHPFLRRWYARDNRYVYSFDGAQLWRYRTADPKQVRLIWKEQHSGYGYGVDYKAGYLDGKITDDGEFIPAPRNEATK